MQDSENPDSKEGSEQSLEEMKKVARGKIKDLQDTKDRWEKKAKE